MATRESPWDRLAHLSEEKERLLEASVYIFAPDSKGFLLHAVRTAIVPAENTLKKTLKRTKLLPGMKRLCGDRLSRELVTSHSFAGKSPIFYSV